VVRDAASFNAEQAEKFGGRYPELAADPKGWDIAAVRCPVSGVRANMTPPWERYTNAKARVHTAG
jgi:hypothetical protein